MADDSVLDPGEEEAFAEFPVDLAATSAVGFIVGGLTAAAVYACYPPVHGRAPIIATGVGSVVLIGALYLVVARLARGRRQGHGLSLFSDQGRPPSRCARGESRAACGRGRAGGHGRRAARRRARGDGAPHPPLLLAAAAPPDARAALRATLRARGARAPAARAAGDRARALAPPPGTRGVAGPRRGLPARSRARRHPGAPGRGPPRALRQLGGPGVFPWPRARAGARGAAAEGRGMTRRAAALVVALGLAAAACGERSRAEPST